MARKQWPPSGVNCNGRHGEAVFNREVGKGSYKTKKGRESKKSKSLCLVMPHPSTPTSPILVPHRRNFKQIKHWRIEHLTQYLYDMSPRKGF